MENNSNIIHQMHYDDKNLNKLGFIDYVQLINKIKYNTLNNEDGQFSFLNEDSRMIFDEKYITAREGGINIFDNPFLRIGACKRQVFFKIKGALGEDNDLNFIEYVERNQLIVNQWIRKFNTCNVLREIEPPVEKNILKLNLKCFSKYYIYDQVKEKEYVLMIKPVNDMAFPIKDRIFHDGKPLINDLCEIALTLLYYNKPVKILYVGKNNSEAYKEINCGISNGFLTYDDFEDKTINLNLLIKDCVELQNLINDEVIPKRDYLINENISIQNLQEMVVNNIITSKDANLYMHQPFTSFQCKLCKYRKICEEIGKDYEVIK